MAPVRPGHNGQGPGEPGIGCLAGPGEQQRQAGDEALAGVTQGPAGPAQEFSQTHDESKPSDFDAAYVQAERAKAVHSVSQALITLHTQQYPADSMHYSGPPTSLGEGSRRLSAKHANKLTPDEEKWLLAYVKVMGLSATLSIKDKSPHSLSIYKMRKEQDVIIGFS